MRIPEWLAEWGKKRIKEFQVEGFVYGQGPTAAKMMLVGEAPGETEILNGVPFSGRAGNELMKFLHMAGVTREQVYITSVVRSRPYKWGEKKDRSGQIVKRKYNRPPTGGEITAHAPILDYEISHVNAPIIVTLGNVSLKRLAGADKSISRVHGSFLRQPVQRLSDDGDRYEWTAKIYTIYPLFHPASIFYNPGLRPLIEQDIERLKNWLEGEHR
ncbi:uracil-DNA glycosylase [Peribacillus sp. SCS-155]|uniref:uracil-DNA glycosylase n=1 Tax=Peribacillus sedimenti TaxID=3115297 RepID=UPI0039059AFB